MSIMMLNPIPMPRSMPSLDPDSAFAFLLQRLPDVLPEWQDVPAHWVYDRMSDDQLDLLELLPESVVVSAFREANLRDLKAVVHGHALRAHQLCTASVQLVDQQQIVAAAACARAALESAVTVRDSTTRWFAAHDRKDVEAIRRVLDSFEQHLEGGRVLGREGVGSTNIMTLFDRLDKTDALGFLARPLYDILCEYTHATAPSLQSFWKPLDPQARRVNIVSGNTGQISDQVVQVVLSSIVWISLVILEDRGRVWSLT